MERNSDRTTPDTIVLVHGLWMTPRSWKDWIERYTERGYRVIAPAWSGLDGEVEQIRRDPTPLAGLGITEIVDHYDRIIRELDRPPIVMGHSFGGAITQILLDRGLGAAGVAISSAPVKGVFGLPISSLRTGWPALKNPANRTRTFPLTPDQFRYRFGNRLSEGQSNEVYSRLYIPGTARVVFQAAFANLNSRAATRVDFRRPGRAPLLMIAGGEDHVSPPSLVRENFKRYRRSDSITGYKEFPGRSHFIAGQEGWEEVADYALAWVTENVGERTPTMIAT
jgi:pimeloyl-ACP methyl ester carboxylesterase